LQLNLELRVQSGAEGGPDSNAQPRACDWQAYQKRRGIDIAQDATSQSASRAGIGFTNGGKGARPCAVAFAGDQMQN
jgi:hypothetical protein